MGARYCGVPRSGAPTPSTGEDRWPATREAGVGQDLDTGTERPAPSPAVEQWSRAHERPADKAKMTASAGQQDRAPGTGSPQASRELAPDPQASEPPRPDPAPAGASRKPATSEEPTPRAAAPEDGPRRPPEQGPDEGPQAPASTPGSPQSKGEAVLPMKGGIPEGTRRVRTERTRRRSRIHDPRDRGFGRTGRRGTGAGDARLAGFYASRSEERIRSRSSPPRTVLRAHTTQVACRFSG